MKKLLIIIFPALLISQNGLGVSQADLNDLNQLHAQVLNLHAKHVASSTNENFAALRLKNIELRKKQHALSQKSDDEISQCYAKNANKKYTLKDLHRVCDEEIKASNNLHKLIEKQFKAIKSIPKKKK